ncbi:hypothetical protein STCU_06129 [Strigomonas culicis]|uniref:COPI associated protein n=1 Tax=Strigomonas culicis TaxID=28005 RepID=S9UD92_9TRYP|nr:hypothetical protein STCU_06129 [Strigomonas culicis]|eukprot:EPY26689.1 hypothetical protein STCU_06129 [Strigomonas culicis]
MPGENVLAPSGFWSRHMHRFYLLCSLLVVILTFVGIIMNLVKVVITPSRVLLDVYCLAFSLLALSAELRQFSWCRRVVYLWLQFFYIIASYPWRGIFYISFGLLLLGDSITMYVAGGFAIVLGIAMYIFSYLLQLPVFEDAQEQRRQQAEVDAFRREELQRREREEHGIETGGVFNNIGHKLSDFRSKLQQSPKNDRQKAAGVVPPTAATGPSSAQSYATPPKSSEPTFEPSMAAAAMFGGGISTAATTMAPRSAVPPLRVETVLQDSVATEPAVAFASTEPAQPPLREQDLTRGGDSPGVFSNREESLKRNFNISMSKSSSSLSLDMR